MCQLLSGQDRQDADMEKVKNILCKMMFFA